MADLLQSSGATISDCGRYRTHLWRQFGDGERVCFVMLNPSTADGDKDDPTIRKCIGFARRWGYGGIEVINLFSWRATDPAELIAAAKRGENIVGDMPACERLAGLSPIRPVVCAWGAHAYKPVLRKLWQWTTSARRFGGADYPRHPLMLAYTTPLVPM